MGWYVIGAYDLGDDVLEVRAAPSDYDGPDRRAAAARRVDPDRRLAGTLRRRFRQVGDELVPYNRRESLRRTGERRGKKRREETRRTGTERRVSEAPHDGEERRHEQRRQVASRRIGEERRVGHERRIAEADRRIDLTDRRVGPAERREAQRRHPHGADRRGSVPVVAAHGWLSAMAHHYDDNAYAEPNDQGMRHLVDGVEPREMTSAERQAYARRLLDEQFPSPEPDPAPKPVTL